MEFRVVKAKVVCWAVGFLSLLWPDKTLKRGMAEAPGRSGFVPPGKGTDIHTEVFEGHGLLSQGFGVPFVEDPGISGAEIQDVTKQPEIPPPSLHGRFVEMGEHVRLVDAPHFTIILLDDRWTWDVDLLPSFLVPPFGD